MTATTRPIVSISFRYFHLRLEAGERGWGTRVNFPERVDFAPATKVGVSCLEEIDRPLQFPCPLFARRYLASSGIDLDNGPCWNQGFQGAIVTPGDAPLIGRR
jgi:hypothetical protein